MTKQEEIKTLQSLKGDTYFAQYFKDSDIDIMCENIRNDFAIEGGTSFATKIDYLKTVIENNDKEVRYQIYCLIGKMIVLAHDPEMENLFEGIIGKLKLIKLKRSKNIPLTNDEIDYLINAATENNQ